MTFIIKLISLFIWLMCISPLLLISILLWDSYYFLELFDNVANKIWDYYKLNDNNK